MSRLFGVGAICALLASANGFSASPVNPATNKGQKPQAKAQVMILGVYHFGNPNLDYVKSNVDDHLSARRQQQIAEVVEMLAKFKPTKIALEAVDGASHVYLDYAAYLKSEYTLSASERDQLGLRLAKQLGHKRVYAIDHKLDMEVEAVVNAAQQTNDTVFLGTFQQVIGELQELQKRQATMTVREILAFHNDPKNIVKGRDLYLQMARVRSADKFVGADVLAGWYQRNFRIYANLARVIESPADRVLVIYGSGHSAILRELIESDATLQLVEPNDYLAPHK